MSDTDQRETVQHDKPTNSKAPDKARRRRAEDRYSEALRREVIGIAVIVVSLCALLALASFHPDDVASMGEAALTGRTKNLIGPVGAHLSDVLLSILGIAAFLIPVTLLLPGGAFVVGRRVSVRLADAIGYPAVVVTSSMLAHVLLDGRIVLGHLAGGLVGATGAEVLRALFGRTGTYLIVYASIALTFILTTRISLVRLFESMARRGFLMTIDAAVRFWRWIRTRGIALREALATRRGRGNDGGAQDHQTDSSAPDAAGDEPQSGDVASPQIACGSAESAPVVVSPPCSGSFDAVGLDELANEGFTMGERTGPAEPTDVVEADEVGAELADPLDREALSERSDTLAEMTPFRPASDGDTAACMLPVRPVVNERKAPTKTELLESSSPGEERYCGYVRPPLKLLDYDAPESVAVDTSYLQSQADKLVEALDTYRIQGRVTEIHPGPVVTMFEFEPAPGVRISKIAGLSDDLAMALKALKVRIVAPIPGKGVVGFEVPNASRETVFLKEIIGHQNFRRKDCALPIALGKDIHGDPVVADLARMPHLLVAGTTGSGKSVGVNCMITSLIYHAGPEDVRMIMVDPKMLELSVYEGIPHLLLPVVTDPKKAAMALKWAVDEMERRYELMKNAGVRDVRGYNRKMAVGAAEPEPALGEGAMLEQAVGDGMDSSSRSTMETDSPTKLPYIVAVIDEFADLMMVAGKEVEYCVARIAQKARAAGIHLVLATQRPSTDVITGVIKANFPTRIAFQVSCGIDSRTILSTNGAENLLGRGDMLFMPPGTSRLNRVHGAYVSEDEICKIVNFVGAQAEPEYLDESVLADPDDGNGEEDPAEIDEAYEDAVRVVARDGRASTSHIQRRLSLGYNRAARIIDQMERDGLVGPGEGAKPRQINREVIAELVARWDGVAA